MNQVQARSLVLLGLVPNSVLSVCRSALLRLAELSLVESGFVQDPKMSSSFEIPKARVLPATARVEPSGYPVSRKRLLVTVTQHRYSTKAARYEGQALREKRLRSRRTPRNGSR